MFDDKRRDGEASILIYKYLEDTYASSEFSTYINRCSSASGCVKKRWYQGHGYEAKPMGERFQIVFRFGDMIESLYKKLIKDALVGEGKLYSEVYFGQVAGQYTDERGESVTVYKQEQLSFKIADITINGHADGWGKRVSDGKWELIEVKSASDYGYKNFEKGETPDYIKQVHALMMTDFAKEKNVKEARFFYMNKNTSHIIDRLYSYDTKIANTVIQEFIISNWPKDKEPVAPHDYVAETYYRKETGRMKLDFPCTYCPYVAHCKPDHEVIMKGPKPVFYKKEF